MSEVTFTGDLKGCLEHLDKRSNGLSENIKLYRHNVMELTGHDPDKPVTALDVIKIVKRVFFDPREAAAQ